MLSGATVDIDRRAPNSRPPDFARAPSADLRHAGWVAAALLSSVFKLWHIAGTASEVALSVAFDALLFGLFGLAAAAVRASGHVQRRAIDVVFFAGLVFGLGIVFAHTWFFDAAVERRLTVFDITGPGLVEFFREVLPGEGRLQFALLMGAFPLLTWTLVRVHIGRWFPRRALLVALCLAVPIGIWAARAPRVPSVLFDSGAEVFALVTLPKVRPSRNIRAQTLARKVEPASDDLLSVSNSSQSPFKKVVVLVMETMTARRFAQETPALPTDTFVRSGLSHAHRYERHFPNNQDSRTGMLNMLFSRPIPYEAYTDRGLAGYESLSGRPSIVDRLQGLGYQTAFAVSQVALEEVVRDLHWDTFLHWTDAEIMKQRERFVCLAPDVYENGCEDLALLPKLLAFLHQHERAFVYQEFIWGHSPEYNERTGLTNTEYYSRYVDALIAGLRQGGLEQETLIVLTSDHGFRDKSLQGARWVYQIPLWFYAAQYHARSSNALTSHADFERLLQRELNLQTPEERAHPTLIVGPTGSGMLAAVHGQDELVLLRRRGPFTLLVNATGVGAQANPGELLGAFELYRADFDAWLRR